MDIEGLVEALDGDADLPEAEATFVERVENAKCALDAGEIDRAEYDERVRAASDRYRRADSM